MQVTKPQPESIETEKPQRFREKTVTELITENRRLVEVPYTASLADTLNALTANRITAVPVAAPPGHWIGAGGSMILEADKRTGAVRKHYIGMVTMFDVLAHIAGNGGGGDLEAKMAVPVSSIIGHCLESLSLWTLNCNTSILDCMEVLSKGIHRALVPIESHMENVAGVELIESASSYRMLTQMDLLRFLRSHLNELKGVMSCQVQELGAVSDTVFGVTDRIRVIDAIKSMNTAAINAIPIVESSNSMMEDHSQLINSKNRKLMGTFSVSDLRGCPISQLQPCLHLTVVQFLEKLSTMALHEVSGLRTSTKAGNVTCHGDTSLGEVVNMAVTNHVHRVWVVDYQGMLVGLISLTDMIRVTRAWMLSEPA